MQKCLMIIPFRLDNEDRFTNLSSIISFYKRYLPTDFFSYAVIEDSDHPTKRMEDLCTDLNIDYHFLNNTGTYTKGRGINYIVKNYSNNFDKIICNDIDAIMHPNSLITLAEPNIDIALPHNGHAIYTNSNGAKFFQDNCSIETLNTLLPKNNSKGYSFIASTNCPGGCVIFNIDLFKSIGGFNPNFKGWGYEDDEILIRARKFGKTIKIVKSSEYNFWHLFHNHAVRGENPNLKFNEALCKYVTNIPNEKIKEYVNLWSCFK